MITFKEYYKNKILTESPMRSGMHFGEYLDHILLNTEETKELLETTPSKDIDLGYFSYPMKYVREVYNEVAHDYFIDPMPSIIAYFFFKEKDNGIYIDSVWRYKTQMGLAFKILTDFYLKKYDFIVSDNKHTTQGEKLWKRIIDYGNSNGNKLSVILRDGEEIDIDDKERFWGNTQEFYDYRINIYKK